ncbi:BA75_00955T0 [Komagataella pastoris]|uniref:BA75_00955T0 n=1 Tax=Komagataella pastoris TaxID=4922 RepID=A0A1B2J8Z2_PICPA|nr:BA75_00955T0 [Komagataella pastoris]
MSKRSNDVEDPPLKRKKVEKSSSYTLYVKNINDKLKPHQLEQQLYYLFSVYGDVVAINCPPKMRGQAFISLSDSNDTIVARNKLQNRVIFGKKLIIEFAKNNSKKIEDSF